MINDQLLLTCILTTTFFFWFLWFFSIRLLFWWSRSLHVIDCYFNFCSRVSYFKVETLLHVGFTWCSRIQLRYFNFWWKIICIASKWVINAGQKCLFSHWWFHFRILTGCFALEEILLLFWILSWLIIALVS